MPRRVASEAEEPAVPDVDTTAAEPVPSPVEWVPIDAVEPHPRNRRQGDVGEIATSIATNGWWGALVVQRRDGEPDRIVAGEHRWRALRFLQSDGIDLPDAGTGDARHWSYDDLAARWADAAPLPPAGFVPVWPLRVDDVQALRDLIVDNRSSDIATMEPAGLAEDLQLLLAEADDGILGTAFDGDDLDALLLVLEQSDVDANAEHVRGLGGASYRVVVECEDEPSQTALFERLEGEGFTCRRVLS